MSIFALQSQVFRLAGSGASISDTSITLVAMKGIEGNVITMAQLGSKAFATIEPGSGDKEEQISFTGITQNPNGTATLTGVKSVSFYTPYTETDGLNKSHSGGVALTLSNTSGFYNALFNSINKFNITAATTANLSIATDLENGDIVDGYTLATGDAVLVKNQTTQSENGVYIVNTSGAATRAGFFNDDLSIRGAILMVAKGTANSGTIWRNTNATAITVGVTNITFDDYVKTVDNVGTGEGEIFRDKVGGTGNLKTIKQSGKITVTNNADDITIDTTAEINTASNVGTGEGTIFKQKTVEDLELKTIKAGTNITITNNADDITISSTDTGEVNTASNVGAGSGLYKQKTGSDLEFKTLIAGAGVSLADNTDDVTITFSPATAKATGAEIDTGTDNDKYVTPKAIADSKISFTDGVETLTNKTLTLPTFTNGTINFNAPQGFLINGKIVRTLDHTINQDLGASTSSADFTTNYWRAQAFTPTQTNLSKIKLSLKKRGAPTGNLTIEIQSDTAGVPSGTVLFSKTLDVSTLTTSYVQYEIFINPTLTVSSGTKYHVCLKGQASWDGTNDIDWGFLAGTGFAQYNFGAGNFTSNNTTVQQDLETYYTAGNMTVAIKTLAGNDPSATDPVYVRIGNTVRSITSALSFTYNASANWLNLGSAELATKEVDLFVYIVWDSYYSRIRLFCARYPSGRIISDFVFDATNEKGILNRDDIVNTATDEVELIGRFNATLSAGPTYTWSIPATDIIINRPIFETRVLSIVPNFTQTTLGNGTVTGTYQIFNNRVHYFASFTLGSTSAVSINVTVNKFPMAPANNFLQASTKYWSGSGTGIGSAVYASGDMYLQTVTLNEYVSTTKPFTWTTGQKMDLHVIYEI